MLSTVRKPILANCREDWNLCLQAMIEALLVFAVCGLFNYTKSVYLH